jgi:Zn-dependent peptidase ImmA (M78 family)
VTLSWAHELGHFIRRTDEPHKYEYVDYRDQRSSTGTDEEEMFANRFAANLLMPELLVKTFHEQELLISGWPRSSVCRKRPCSSG